MDLVPSFCAALRVICWVRRLQFDLFANHVGALLIPIVPRWPLILAETHDRNPQSTLLTATLLI